MTLPSHTKKDLRQTLRRQRQALSSSECAHASAAVIKQLTQSELFKKSQHIAVYLSEDNEIDLSSLFSLHPEKNYYLPVLTPEKQLLFKSYKPNDSLKPNIYGIPEPVEGDFFNAKELDLVCLPLVGFDMKGHRLGMGGGYYDRTFAFKLQTAGLTPHLLGIAYEFQKVDLLPSDSWDVSLYGVLTEQDLHYPLHQ
jgi:5-formyltetrahydrofolate cyclo-ligase